MFKVCACEMNMADKIVEYCQKEIASHEQMKQAVMDKRSKEIEQAKADELKIVINYMVKITGKNYQFPRSH